MAEAPAAPLSVEVCWIGVEPPLRVALSVAPGTTVAEALARSGIAARIAAAARGAAGPPVEAPAPIEPAAPKAPMEPATPSPPVAAVAPVAAWASGEASGGPLDGLAVAVFGRRVPPGEPLHDGDRIELLPPLRVDPMVARRRRAEHRRRETGERRWARDRELPARPPRESC
jgi:putative ubiquitin-RnfH superfamily antitoxin RatB of RatAB toxin-antitoxin module